MSLVLNNFKGLIREKARKEILDECNREIKELQEEKETLKIDINKSEMSKLSKCKFFLKKCLNKEYKTSNIVSLLTLLLAPLIGWYSSFLFYSNLENKQHYIVAIVFGVLSFVLCVSIWIMMNISNRLLLDIISSFKRKNKINDEIYDINYSVIKCKNRMENVNSIVESMFSKNLTFNFYSQDLTKEDLNFVKNSLIEEDINVLIEVSVMKKTKNHSPSIKYVDIISYIEKIEEDTRLEKAKGIMFG